MTYGFEGAVYSGSRLRRHIVLSVNINVSEESAAFSFIIEKK